ncbi:MAG: type II toxin-antitoxin system PemK/MazF family toxin [Xanthobacteraceae bacterium]
MPISDDARCDCWDVVVVPFSYTDRLAEKRRPALVVSNEKLKPYGLLWIAMITSATNKGWPCDVLIADLANAGLPAPSVVRTAKLACIDSGRVLRTAGKLDEVTVNAVRENLTAFLF